MRDGDAQVFLLAMQNRLQADPWLALGVAPTASAADARTAFLSLTKQYHPVKFARCDTMVQRLANEVFLQLRDAHDAVAKSARSAIGTGKTKAVGAATTTGPVRVVAATPPVTKASTPVPVASQTPTPRSPPGVTVPRAITPTNSPTHTRAVPVTPKQPVASVASSAKSAASTPATRPSAPLPIAAKPAAAPAVTAKPAAAPPANPSPTPAGVSFRNPAHAPSATPSAAPAAIGPNTSNENELFTKGKELLRQKKWHEARDVFVALTRLNNAESAYQAMLALARGRVDQTTGNIEGARTHYTLALQLEPAFTAAATALDEIGPAESKSSLWSKLRGK